ncbi:MAG: hypothetical protein R8G01_08750 [Ilumatobacteraceae bacterium]|nr:hypothetical protein [Ilumatobacteraceae bacterium]
MNDTPTPTTDTSTSGSKRSTTIGVAAGLLAGGAIGLVATVPSLTSAASDDGADAVVVLQDDTDENTDENTDETTDTADERPELGDRLRESLQDLVDDGTITEAQADTVAEHLVENRPERSERPGRTHRRGLDGHRGDGAVLADILGVDTDTLRSELAAGNSIADIAEANGVDVQAVIDALIADAESHVDMAVDHGLDEERAAERLERLAERIEDGVYRTRGNDG